MQEVERAVERVIQSIHENYGEQITVDDMARTAMYSKFHFTRIFQRVTGLTPGRFLSAVRLQKAKQLLTSTSWKVTDISQIVGYTSVGTFSSRFASSVGLPPTAYRELGGYRPWTSVHDKAPAGERVDPERRSVIRGHISFRSAEPDNPIFVGLFPERIPRGQPVRCTVLSRPGPYVLEDVPAGSWYVMACSPRPDRDAAAQAAGQAAGGHRRNGRGEGYAALLDGCVQLSREQALWVGSNGPITIQPGMVRLADVRLRPMSPLDPPVVLALPDMRPENLAARADSAA
ncbi:MAG TPA: AraC family transcriptional regulator [Streptosporangiaceae bacterium]